MQAPCQVRVVPHRRGRGIPEANRRIHRSSAALAVPQHQRDGHGRRCLRIWSADATTVL